MGVHILKKQSIFMKSLFINNLKLKYVSTLVLKKNYILEIIYYYIYDCNYNDKKFFFKFKKKIIIYNIILKLN